MSLHDEYARLTPFELAFADSAALEGLSAAVARESVDRGLDASDFERFLRLDAVGDFVRGLRADDAPPDDLIPFAALVFHGVHFLRAGRPLYLLSTGAVRRLVAEAPRGMPSPPAPAGYLQLPQHLVWAAAAHAGPPESLDGAFWTASAGDVLHVLPVTGMRPDRPGFGAVPLPAAPLSDAVTWLDAAVRPAGGDFGTSLPGGDLDELFGVEAAGEVLKLVARFFAHASAEPATLAACGAAVPGQGPPPSALPYTRVVSAP